MQIRLLMNDIVRQTTLLIAQLSTAAGVREPLSHVTDQVFLELSRELDARGIRLKVAADMFGMTLRSYQLKVRRLSEQNERHGACLWQAIFERLQEGGATREELIQRFGRHDPKRVAATLCDMVESGVAYSSGRGPKTAYGVIAQGLGAANRAADESELLKERIWYLVAKGTDRADLPALLQASREEVEHAAAELVDLGHLEATSVGTLTARRFEVAVGAARGWETAVGDHFRAVVTAVAAKIARRGSERDDRIGGATLTFTVHAGHPEAEEVYRLLETTRAHADALWRRVARHNDEHPPPATATRVTFYFGQNLAHAGSSSVETEEPSREGEQDADELAFRRRTA
jgi:hypothetical protein